MNVKGFDDCWLWTGKLRPCGNAQWRWKGHLRLVHHIALEISCGVIIPRRTRRRGSGGVIFRHSCDIPSCCNPRHLLPGTQFDNMQDRERRGRTPRGENHPCSKLTDIQIRSIRRRFKAGGLLKKDLGEKYGIDPSWIGRIVNNKTRIK